ncbi:MAG: carbohydrate ABC transporter permease [Desulfomonilia bacterium]|jgi:ABC-type glycerol-3-phosphate transport system permease component|nr:carbohydrate ABC transporter permease [Sphaerochaeta sp.]MDX9916372.1 carbohydrate ABC transporter permease [Sphaerochaeta sp.]
MARIVFGKKRPSWFIGRTFTHLVLIFFALAVGLPFFWMLTTALKNPVEVATFPPIWWPKTIKWDNFSKAWSTAPFGRFYINSFVTAITGVLLEVSIAALSAYAFACIRFKYRDFFFLVMLAALMIPSQIALIPNYVILSKLKWINTYKGIVIPYVSSVFGTFLLRQYFLSVPSSLYEAAEIDGLSHFKTLTYIALPLAKPVLGTLVLYIFIGKWNNYLWPLIVTTKQRMRTLPVGLAMVRDAEYAIGPEHLMAAAIFVLVPVLIVYFFSQRKLIEAIAAGAVKG